MSIAFHPSASAAFNEKATALLQLVQEIPRPPSVPTSFPSDVHVAASLTEQDIIGDMEESLTDRQGNTVARFFYFNGKRYGLKPESYEHLRNLASTIGSVRGVKDKLSTSYIENILFGWIKDSFYKESLSTTFCDVLTLTASRDVILSTSWIPIANLEIEIPFPIGSVEFRPISTSLINMWEAKTPSIPEARREGYAQLFQKVRKRFQGRAAAVISVEAEPDRAFEISVEMAELATSLLAIFSGGTLLPDIKCLSKISGCETISKATVIVDPDKDSFRMRATMLDLASARSWRLDRREILKIRKSGLDVISELLNC